MKKLLALFAIILSVGWANAQTEAQTLEWLNTKKAEIYCASSRIFEGYCPTLEINENYLKVYDRKGSYTKILWNEIKDIKEGIKIVSNEMYQGKNVYLVLRFFQNQELEAKYLKALKHMATLKGAKLVNDDLF